MGVFLNISTFTPTQTLWLVSIGATIFYLIQAYKKRSLSDLSKIRLNFSHILFFLVSGLSGVLWFTGLTMIPIGQAVLLYNIRPIIVLILAIILLNERLTSHKIIAAILGFIGVLFTIGVNTLQVQVNSSLFMGIIIVLGASILSAVQNTLLKKRSITHPQWVTTLMIVVSQLIFTSPFIIVQKWDITPLAVGAVLFLCYIGTIVAFKLYLNSFKNISTSSIVMLGYIEPFLAATWGYIFLHQTLSPSMIVGGVCILVAGFFAVKSEIGAGERT